MQKEIKITYLKKAQKFLDKNRSVIKESEIDKLMISAIKRIVFYQDVNIDLKALKGDLKGKYRIRKGKVRIIFEIKEDEVIIESIVENIDFRGSVY